MQFERGGAALPAGDSCGIEGLSLESDETSSLKKGSLGVSEQGKRDEN